MDINTIIQGIEVTDVIITALAGNTIISEVLPFMKKRKSNSTIQLVFNIFKAIAGALKQKPSQNPQK